MEEVRQGVDLSFLTPYFSLQFEAPISSLRIFSNTFFRALYLIDVLDYFIQLQHSSDGYAKASRLHARASSQAEDVDKNVVIRGGAEEAVLFYELYWHLAEAAGIHASSESEDGAAGEEEEGAKDK